MKTEEFIRDYKEIFEGEPWYGQSLMETLTSISFPLVNYKPAGNFHSIAGLVKHMLIWRKFVVEKLRENEEFDIELNSPADWNENPKLSNATEWSLLLKELKVSQKEIESALVTKNEDWANEPAPGKNYANHYMLRGIVCHDIYHLGQIRLLKKLAEENLRPR